MTTRFQCKNNVNIKRWMTSLKEQQKKKLGRAMEEAAREIVQRTQGGREIENANFKAYTPEYARYKAKTGRGFKLEGWEKRLNKSQQRKLIKAKAAAGISITPDLTFKGRMLANIRTKVFEQGEKLIGMIFFFSQAEGNKARWNQAIRPFFGLSRAQRAAIVNKLK